MWGSTARAYNAAYANGTNPLADLVDATTGTVAICTLRVLTTGFVDLTGTYCLASTTPATACAAAAGGFCKVTKLYDQTGNGNHWTNATASSMPSLTFSALNSLPGMTFIVANSSLLATGNTTVSYPFSGSAVAERTGSTAAVGVVFGGPSITYEFGFQNSANTALSSFTGSITATASDSSFHALQHVNAGAAGASSFLTVDGSDTSGTTTNSGWSAQVLRIGRGASCCTLPGVVMEAGVWSNTTFSGTDRTNLNTNQHGANGYNF